MSCRRMQFLPRALRAFCPYWFPLRAIRTSGCVYSSLNLILASVAPPTRSPTRALTQGLPSRRRQFALDLGAMHDAALLGIEGVAAVHGAAVVPQHEVADAPDMLPGELRPVD